MRNYGCRAWTPMLMTLAVLAATTLVGAFATASFGATRWLTDADLYRQLTQPVDAVWSEMPLRDALRGLSRDQRVAILIDRRVDPGQKLKLELDGEPLRAAFLEIARDRKLGLSMFGPVAFFGPPEVSSRLRTIAALRREAVQKLPAPVVRRFLQKRAWKWDDLAEPRELLAQLAKENGIRIEGLDRVPHDLWAAADLPPLSLIDRLTLVAVQFNVTFEVSPDGNTVRLVPLPAEVALVRSYPGGADPTARAKKYGELAPNAQIKVVGETIYVKGLVEDHGRITSPPRQPVHPRITAADEGFARKRFTVNVESQPIGPLLEQLAKKLKLDLRIDREALEQAGVSLDQRVSFSVQGATIDRLLREMLKSCPLKYHRRDRVLEIGPAE